MCAQASDLFDPQSLNVWKETCSEHLLDLLWRSETLYINNLTVRDTYKRSCVAAAFSN